LTLALVWSSLGYAYVADEAAGVRVIDVSAEPVRIHLGVHDAAGALLGVRTMDLAPYSNDQINRVLSDWAPVSGYIDVWAEDDDALYACYGSVLDNRTSDPTTVLPQ
jgi:hypothetical protein